MSIVIDGLEKKIPEGIELLGEDDLYNVPFDLISLADEINEDVKEDYIWSNPRRFGKNEKQDGNGFDKLPMQELGEAIKSDGLLFPIICRWVITENGELGIQVVDGERRYLSIQSLRTKGEKCWSRKSKTLQDAKDVYAKLPCRVISGDDKEALKIAFMVSDRAINWGDGAVAKLIKKLRDTNNTDQEILHLTKKTPGWLREQDRLCSLDELTFSYLADSKINRALALKLADIEDVDVRHKKLVSAYEDAVIIHKETTAHLDKIVEKAEVKLELAEAVLEESKIKGDEEAIQDAQEELIKAQEKIESRRKRREATIPPVAKTTNLKNVQNEEKENIPETENTEISNSVDLPLSVGKIKKHSEQIQTLLDAGGKDADGKNIIQPKILQVLKSYIDKCVIGGEEDVLKFLKRQRAIIMLQNKRIMDGSGTEELTEELAEVE